MVEIEHGWFLLLYFGFVIGYTTPPRQSLYLELIGRISKKRQQAQEGLYDKLPEQNLATSRTGILIDCQVWLLFFVVKSSSSLALFWL